MQNEANWVKGRAEIASFLFWKDEACGNSHGATEAARDRRRAGEQGWAGLRKHTDVDDTFSTSLALHSGAVRLRSLVSRFSWHLIPLILAFLIWKEFNICFPRAWVQVSKISDRLCEGISYEFHLCHFVAGRQRLSVLAAAINFFALHKSSRFAHTFLQFSQYWCPLSCFWL